MIGNVVMVINQEASVIGSGSNIVSPPHVLKHTQSLHVSNSLLLEVFRAMPHSAGTLLIRYGKLGNIESCTINYNYI